ncbi:MAG TPA: class I SAM-dependent methyltransferase [Thermoanaerobaculia bacterium]|nr:class I SAM-dependent methyltransferase [Thermoanaerobaculia bacterium]
MTWYQEWFGEDYLDLYSYRDEEEARQHVSFFKTHVGALSGPLLDLACGSGRHTDEFRQEGYRAIGCDLSIVLLQAGRAQYGDLSLVRGDMRRLPFASGSFGGLVNFFTSFGYFENEEENELTVSEMARVLRGNSPLLFDYLNVHRELQRLVQREEKEIDGTRVLIDRWFDGSSRTFNKRIVIGSKRYLERVKGYDLDEISTFFGRSGLAVRQVYGDFDGSPFMPDSPRMIVIGVKRR